MIGQIAQGILIFLGVARDDSTACADYLVKKITELRIFEDAQGKMNRVSPGSRGPIFGCFSIHLVWQLR